MDKTEKYKRLPAAIIEALKCIDSDETSTIKEGLERLDHYFNKNGPVYNDIVIQTIERTLFDKPYVLRYKAASLMEYYGKEVIFDRHHPIMQADSTNE